MANFARVQPAGWALNQILSSTEANALDINMTKAANFSDGSAHTPAADIEVTGPFGLKLMGSLRLKYEARVVTRMMPLLGILDAASFAYQTAEQQIIQSVAAGTVCVPLNLPHGQVLNSITLRLRGAAGHTAGNITATPPVISVEKCAKDDAAPTVIATNNDTTVTATYQALHDLSCLAIAHTIDRETYRYTLRIDGEVAGDFQAGSIYFALLGTCTISGQDEWTGG